MKSLLMLLAVAAITIGQVRALQCHVCESSDNCKKQVTCSSSSRFCKTSINYQSLSGNLVKKECVENCDPQNGEQYKILCCSSDLCNSKTGNSAPVHTILSHAVLALSLTLALVSVLY
ncbi:lymphocyte antigen 6D [Monodelphis domestica]|uniref:Lymphocyte antigen 6 family member D n=1 Tax=Monodelphis domestica TaxID=13616 RepID=K7E147_MONDO|nr:lymphocyte antigen 6D [Monodelphis domestica]